jgi:phage terminase large subunit-like protein
LQSEVSSWPPRWLTPVSDDALARSAGDEVSEFINTFGVITKDTVAGRAGSPLQLRGWQSELLRHVFARSDRGFAHSVSLIGVPRKNGKSALASGVALWSLLAGARGGEIYSCAADKDQARIVFRDAKSMLEAEPELAELTKVYKDAIEVPSTGSVYRVLSAEAFSKEGLSPTLVLFDELHAQPNRELFDVMSLAGGARGGISAGIFAITTAGVKVDSTGQDSIAYNLYQYGQKVARGEIDDPTFFMAWWEAAQEADHRDPDTWRGSNPGFDDICVADDFASAVRRTPEPEFRTKRCNQWVSSATSWLPTGTWEALEAERPLTDDDEVILGFDGSFNGDTTVIVGTIIPKTEEEKPHVFMVKAWEKDDSMGDEWRVNIQDVEATILDFCAKYRVREVACDPYRWQRSMEVLADAGVPIVEYPSTSARRMVTACAKFYDYVTDKRLTHDGNPLLIRHLSNAVVKSDNLGVRIVKENRNSNRRIDAAVAGIIGFDRAVSSKLEEELVPVFFSF